MSTAVCNPFHSEKLASLLTPATQRPPGFEKIVAESDTMLEVLNRTRRVARTDSTVLITGESGTGKELIADAIRENSRRRDGPFITVNMAAVPETLAESELFGHVKGSFTGAAAHRTGRMEAADGGTLFIDEIGDLATPTQAKLLRVLEDYKITPVGGNQDKRVDVRLVAATSRDLPQMTASGEFREDLYYRLNVVHIHLPALRDRRGDILLLVKHFLSQLCRECNSPLLSIDRELLHFLVEHDWPGNVRQLRNCIESMVVLARYQTLTKADLPETVWNDMRSIGTEPALPPDRTLLELEKMAVMQRLERENGNRRRAARSLGISVRTLQRKLKKWKNDPRHAADHVGDDGIRTTCPTGETPCIPETRRS